VGSTTDGQKTKIALLSFLALREAIGELKQRYDKLQSEFGPRANEIDSLQNSIEAKEKVLSENKGLTIQAARTLTDQVEQLKREYQRKLEDSQELARKRESEETAPVLEKISDFLENTARSTASPMYLMSVACRRPESLFTQLGDEYYGGLCKGVQQSQSDAGCCCRKATGWPYNACHEEAVGVGVRG
jgi:Skp family chaperone for outer membrane proteins